MCTKAHPPSHTLTIASSTGSRKGKVPKKPTPKDEGKNNNTTVGYDHCVSMDAAVNTAPHMSFLLENINFTRRK